jgi:DNA modification methylase
VTPYYQDKWVTIYHGDCREILPQLERGDVIITDPVWPNCSTSMVGATCPFELLKEAAINFPGKANRAVIHLGCTSDPRFLLAIPPEMPFLRTCWLEYVRLHYIGRILYTSDVAYVFGKPPISKDGRRVIPGRHIAVTAEKRLTGHPAPRKLEHVRWLVNWFADGVVIDPFLGSGTTIQAARECGYRSIGIEIVEKYCEMAANRCSQDVMELQGA